MNPIISYRRLLPGICLVIIAGLLTQCHHDKEPVGYTGELKDTLSKKLVNVCHFIPQDSVKIWTARFQRDSIKGLAPETQQAMAKLSSTAISFNSCIIRELINNKESIGLRVLFGMSADGRLHIIFVGIKPDYSNLYVQSPKECCGDGNLMDHALNMPPPPGGSGGAEYGQMP